jgi:hypothetical protein
MKAQGITQHCVLPCRSATAAAEQLQQLSGSQELHSGADMCGSVQAAAIDQQQQLKRPALSAAL